MHNPFWSWLHTPVTPPHAVLPQSRSSSHLTHSSRTVQPQLIQAIVFPLTPCTTKTTSIDKPTKKKEKVTAHPITQMDLLSQAIPHFSLPAQSNQQGKEKVTAYHIPQMDLQSQPIPHFTSHTCPTNRIPL